MPHRKKNSPNWHYDFVLRGRRFHGSCGTSDLAEAKAVEAEARVAARAALTAPQAPSARYTVGQALGTYWQDTARHQPSAATSRSQAARLLGFLDAATPIEALTTAQLMGVVTRFRAEVSNATVNRHLQFLARALRHMERSHGAKIPELDFSALRLKESRERVRELTQAEQAALFDALRPDLAPLVAAALMTGARRATLLGLEWRDVDRDSARIRFRLKGGGEMRFPIGPELGALLDGLPRSGLVAERRFVFTYESRRDGQRYRISEGGGIWEDWRRALAAAGIADFRFHDLRHTFATRLLRQTGNLKLVSRLLGHTLIETTNRYAHVLDEDLAQGLAGYRVLDPARAIEGGSRTNSRTDR